MADVLLTDREVGEILGCSPDTLRRLCLSGKLRAVTVGRSRRYRAEWVDEFIDTQTERQSRAEAQRLYEERARSGAQVPSSASARRHGLKTA